MLGSWSDRPRIGTDSSDSSGFIFTVWTWFWGRSRTKAPIFTSSSSRFWGKSRTKASFSHLPLSVFEGSLAQKLHFHICHFQILREVSHEMRFGAAISDAVARSSIVLRNSVFADRIAMAASRLLGAAAACVILLSFAAGHRESYWSGCIKAAILICSRFSQCWRCWFSFSRAKGSSNSGEIAILQPRRQPFRTKRGSIVKNRSKIAIWSVPRQPFRMKWGSITKNWSKIAILSVPR